MYIDVATGSNRQAKGIISPWKKNITESPYGKIKIEDCIWYHGFKFVQDAKTIKYELEPIKDKFLLPNKVAGVSFLDIGTACGYFSFEMEKRGADMVSFDIAVDEKPDMIPYPNSMDRTEANKEFIKKIT